MSTTNHDPEGDSRGVRSLCRRSLWLLLVLLLGLSLTMCSRRERDRHNEEDDQEVEDYSVDDVLLEHGTVPGWLQGAVVRRDSMKLSL